jgi:hypothetical protein
MTAIANDEVEPSDALRQLATAVGRPAQSLQALDRLEPRTLTGLTEAVAAAEARERDELETAYRAALPAVIRPLVMKWLRRGVA